MPKSGAVSRQETARAKIGKRKSEILGKRVVVAIFACVGLAGGVSKSLAQQSESVGEFDVHRNGGQLHLGSAYQLPKSAVSFRAGVLYPRTGLSQLDENLTFGRFGAA